jgi:hypothetical protein
MHVSYIANGFCGSSDVPGEMQGLCELRFWNPTHRPTTVRMTVYYAERPPVSLPPYDIEPEANPLLVFPHDYAEHFADCGPWGMRLVSDTMLMADHILSARRNGPPQNVKYRGGVGDTLLKTRPARLWYFSDGIRINQSLANPQFPFHEFEWYHILNPGRRDAHVVMRCVLAEGRYEDLEYSVGAERVLMYDNYDMSTDRTVCYGIRFMSDVPVVVESERVIYGLEGLDEWGANIHCQRPGLPAPLEWNEDDGLL